MNRRLPRLLPSGLACLLVLLPGAGVATTARLAALGGGSYLEDDRNVLRWYGSLVDYPDEVVAEGGHFTLPEGWHDTAGSRVSGPGLGAHVRLDEAGRWGTLAAYWHGHGDDVDPGSLERDRLGTTWSGMWGRRFGRLQAAALVRSGTRTDTAGAVSAAHERTEFGLGLRADVSDGAYLDLAGEWRRHEVAVGGGLPATHEGDGLGLRGRAFVRLGAATALVPLAEYLISDRPLPVPAAGLTQTMRGHLVKLGVGVNWYPDADHVLVAGIDHLHGHRDRLAAAPGGDPTVYDGRRWDAFAIGAGFESRFRFWLVFRGSFRYESVSETTTDGLVDEDYARFGINVGAACQLGPADLDLALSDHEPRLDTGTWAPTLAADPSTWLTVTFRWRF